MRLDHYLTILAATGTIALGATSARAATIQVDFGDDPDQNGETTSLSDWNTLGERDESSGQPVSIADLIDSNGNNTGVSLTTGTDIIGDSDNGPTTITTPASNIFPDPVATDYYYGSELDGNSESEVVATVTFAGLDSNLTYDFDLFAGREGNSNDRTATYTFTGSNSASGTLDAAQNTSEYLSLNGVAPDSNDEIALTLSDHPDNQADNFYINGLVINEVPVPEPGSLALLGLASLMMLPSRRRRTA